jgi:hypothetical protein
MRGSSSHILTLLSYRESCNYASSHCLFIVNHTPFRKQLPAFTLVGHRSQESPYIITSQLLAYHQQSRESLFSIHILSSSLGFCPYSTSFFSREGGLLQWMLYSPASDPPQNLHFMYLNSLQNLHKGQLNKVDTKTKHHPQPHLLNTHYWSCMPTCTFYVKSFLYIF